MLFCSLTPRCHFAAVPARTDLALNPSIRGESASNSCMNQCQYKHKRPKHILLYFSHRYSQSFYSEFLTAVMSIHFYFTFTIVSNLFKLVRGTILFLVLENAAHTFFVINLSKNVLGIHVLLPSL